MREMRRERFYKWVYGETVIYHRGRRWRGPFSEDIEISKEEYVRYRLQQIERIKKAGYPWTEEAKKNAIAQIIGELRELGVKVEDAIY